MRQANRITLLGAIAMASCTLAPVASAQTVGIGTTKGGATNQVSTGIALVASRHAGMQMRTQPMAGTQQYIPAVNTGSLEFGVANIMQTKWAIEGNALSAGKPNPNLRMVATLMAFRTGPLVAKDSGIRSVADLKGKRVPDQFSAAPLFRQMVQSFLANAAISDADVRKVPATSLQQHWDMLTERRIDVVVATVGTGYLDLMAQKLGGVKFIQMDASPAALQRTRALLPGVDIKSIKPGAKTTGLDEPTSMLVFDYTVFAGKGVSDDVVYRVAKAIEGNRDELVGSSALWRSFDPAGMAKDQGIAYHPGAERFYKEKGIWRR